MSTSIDHTQGNPLEKDHTLFHNIEGLWGSSNPLANLNSATY